MIGSGLNKMERTFLTNPLSDESGQRTLIWKNNMTENPRNDLQILVRPPTNPENPDARNGSVGVQRETLTFFNAGQDELTFYDYFFVFRDVRGKEEIFEGFLTLGDAMRAGRAYAEARNAVFES